MRTIKNVLTAATALCGAMGVSATAEAQTATRASSTTAPRVYPNYRNIRPFYRNIRAFWGDVNPFYRNIRAFWGDVDPFYRNIRAFWGNIDPILYAQAGKGPQFASIGPFWDDLGAQWSDVSNNWQTAGGYAENQALYGSVAQQLQAMMSKSEATWGASVKAQTGKSFQDGFAKPLFSRFNIDPNDPSSLSKLSAAEQSHLFIDWYDGLMNYAGIDHVDHWMKEINWTPKLTQTQGGGSGEVIGLVDFFVAGDTDIQSKVAYSGGFANYSTGHGAGVASLMVSSHDGKGIMGIAPNAKLAVYNPFDATGTAEWSDVTTAIAAVTSHGASVVNLSLGEPGSALSGSWRDVFTNAAVKAVNGKTLYVIAAGNDGIAQTGTVNFKDALDSTFIVVGSVDPTGRISEFSNLPGDACLVDDKKCKDDPKRKVSDMFKEGGLLMRRFIVAPGELILVSDDAGGVVRESGTLLAAPLVTGAIALLHDRWPWLKNYPRETASIILGSAKDLGAPGVDAVYGVGMLDVEASQSPLDFNALTYSLVNGTKTTSISAKTLRSGGLNSSWETNGLYITAIEKIESTQRDFLIPLSSRLFGTTKNGDYFQDYVYNRMTAWMNGSSFVPMTGQLSFGDGNRASVRKGDGWSFGMTARVSNPYQSTVQHHPAKLASTFYASAPSGKWAMAMGRGDGAIALAGGGGFTEASDYNPYTGGANPLLGFASGGSHVAVSASPLARLQITAGVTQSDANMNPAVQSDTNLADRLKMASRSGYRSSAAHARVDYQLGKAVAVYGAMTRLREADGLLGVRSMEVSDLAGGSTSESMSVGGQARLPAGFSIAASATALRTRTADRSTMLQAGGAGLIGTSYQLDIAKQHLLGGTDHLRVSLAQPLTIEHGRIDFKSLQVIDRETGELGVTTQSIDVSSKRRRLVAEAAYGVTLVGGRATLSAFGRSELNGAEAGTPGLMAGAQAKLDF